MNPPAPLDEVGLSAVLEGIHPGFVELVQNRPQNYGTDGSYRDLLSAFRGLITQPQATPDWPAVAAFINAYVDGRNGPLDLAISKVLLEGLAQPGHLLEQHLTGAARHVWDLYR